MTTLAAGLLAAGLPMFVIAGMATPQGLYQEPDTDVRLRIIREARARFLLAQLLWAAWLAVPALGFGLLSMELSASIPWLPTAAALTVGAAALAAAGYVVLQTVDPRRFWLEGAATWVATLAGWLLLLAAGMYGVAMGQLDTWLVAGIVLLAYAGVGSLIALLVSAPAFYLGAGFCLAALAPALVLWQMQPA